MKYTPLETGRKLRINKGQYVFLTSKRYIKKNNKEDNIIGYISFESLKNKYTIESDDSLLVKGKDYGISPIAKLTPVGYISVMDNNEIKYIGLYSKSRFISFLLTSFLIITRSLPVAVLGTIVALATTALISNSTNDNDISQKYNDLKSAVTEAYNGSGVENGNYNDSLVAENNEAIIDVYSYFELNMGDVIPLTNNADNNVCLYYKAVDENGNEVLDSGIIKPSEMAKWEVKSLGKGKHELLLTVTLYSLDLKNKYNSYPMPVEIIIN